MKLRKLAANLTNPEIRGNRDVEIEYITYDSRKVRENSLFICIEGFEEDGHRYAGEAINNGARAVLIEHELNHYVSGITYLKVTNTRRAMSSLAAAFYKYPLTDLSLIGVTGTNGKTTTTYLIKSILEKAGYKTGLIGTINNIIDDKTIPASRTTPESLDLYRIFREMADNDLKYAVMEVSSHALDLDRVYGMNFTVAVFTNISQDHLDYHASIEDYLRAKSLLFTQLKEEGMAVINIDDDYSDRIAGNVAADLLTYGIEKKADLQARDILLSARDVSFQLIGEEVREIKLNLSGRFNVYNALAAAGAARGLKINYNIIKKGLESVTGVPGRFEIVEGADEFSVVVDYAHTPDGMENVLTTALDLVSGKIIVVFGCGGDRDKSKRPRMGRIAARYGDYCVITSDNPRSEEPLTIISEIEGGIKSMSSPAPYVIIPDRREAIYQAVQRAEKQDMVIIFGKGHETYQVFRDKTIHFDDREVAKEALSLERSGKLDEVLNSRRNQ